MARYKKPSNYGLWEEIVCGKNKGLMGEKTLKLWFMGRNKGLREEIKVHGKK